MVLGDIILGDIVLKLFRSLVTFVDLLLPQRLKGCSGVKNIDVMITDMAHLYGESVIIPNVKTDIPDGQPGGGKPSDHPIVYSRPRSNMMKQPEKEVIIKTIRRFNKDKKMMVGHWIQQESLEEVFDAGSSSRMAVKF